MNDFVAGKNSLVGGLALIVTVMKAANADEVVLRD